MASLLSLQTLSCEAWQRLFRSALHRSYFSSQPQVSLPLTHGGGAIPGISLSRPRSSSLSRPRFIPQPQSSSLSRPRSSSLSRPRFIPQPQPSSPSRPRFIPHPQLFPFLPLPKPQPPPSRSTRKSKQQFMESVSLYSIYCILFCLFRKRYFSSSSSFFFPHSR